MILNIINYICVLEYPTPSPNVHEIMKVFKEGDKIYEEL